MTGPGDIPDYLFIDQYFFKHIFPITIFDLIYFQSQFSTSLTFDHNFLSITISSVKIL